VNKIWNKLPGGVKAMVSMFTLLAALVAMGFVASYSGHRYREEHPSATIQCTVEEVEALRPQITAIAKDESAVGTIIEFRDGNMAMVANVSSDGYGYASVYGKTGWMGIFNSQSSRSELCFIRRVILQSDLDYADKKTALIKLVGEIPPAVLANPRYQQ
jgi:hypothetical protein